MQPRGGHTQRVVVSDSSRDEEKDECDEGTEVEAETTATEGPPKGPALGGDAREMRLHASGAYRAGEG